MARIFNPIKNIYVPKFNNPIFIINNIAKPEVAKQEAANACSNFILPEYLCCRTELLIKTIIKNENNIDGTNHPEVTELTYTIICVKSFPI